MIKTMLMQHNVNVKQVQMKIVAAIENTDNGNKIANIMSLMVKGL